MDSRFNKVFPSFDPLNLELSLGCRIIDTFSSHFSFHSFNKCSNNSLILYLCKLDKMTIASLENLSHTLVIIDMSIKNNVATSIAHIHIYNKPVIKTLYYTVNINSMEAELFAIRCSINQATNSTDISKIIVITDSIHMAKKIFDLLLHPFQIHSIFILHEFQKFFALNQENSIEFWECLSQCNWSLHKVVDKETKVFNPSSLFLCKLLWDYSQKKKCFDF